MVDGYLTKPAEKVVLVGRARSDLLANYVNLAEKGGIVAPMITYAYREHLYASLSDLYGSGHLPDSLCAMALTAKGVGVPVVTAESLSPDDMERIWAEADAEAGAGGPARGTMPQRRRGRRFRYR